MSRETVPEAAAFLRTFDDSRFPPDFLKDYDMLECLSQNEYSETYLVISRETGCRAVAKCYMGQLLPYVQEHELLKRLHHKSLPAYLGTYSAPGMLCVLREYVAGLPLHKVMEERSFAPSQVLSIGLELCGILQYLHTQTPPVIHRDIKPENIILRPDGSVALIDFGISRAYRQGADGDTLNFGTKCFSAPEQYGYAQTDCRSDLFSLGMVMGYLLTGSTRVETFSTIKDRELARVIQTCTAFNPADRYSDANALRRALCALRPVQRRRRRWLMGAVSLLIIAALAAAGWGYVSASRRAPLFTEPLIEQAVRAFLGKSDTEEITREELLRVDTLCVFSTTVSPDQDGFYAAAADWYASGSAVRGTITSLSDLELLPNLRVVCLAAQQIADLSSLPTLLALEKVEFKHNHISDISVLAELPALSSAGLNGNPIADISPLAACAGLRFLDLCNVEGYDPSFLTALGDFEFLDLANGTDSFAYLGKRRIRELKLGRTGLDSLAWLSGITSLQSLEVKFSALTSLDGIEAHSELTYLNIAGCRLDDLSPIARLPALQTLVLSEDMRPALEALGAVSFTVSYE